MVVSVKILLVGTTELNGHLYPEETWFLNWSLQTLTGSPECDKRTKGRMREVYQVNDQGFSFLKQRHLS